MVSPDEKVITEQIAINKMMILKIIAFLKILRATEDNVIRKLTPVILYRKGV